MTELPKTEAELQALLEAKEQEVTENLTAKHNGEMASIRKKHEAELTKAKEQANMSAQELAEQKVREQQEHDAQELAELRQFKKNSVLTEKLKREGLPEFFKNDTRLLNAEEDKVDEVINTIMEEFKKVLPEGARINTNINGGDTPPNGDKFASFRKEGIAK